MSDKIEKIIDALRKKILESAIRGELVPQNPDDEPACVLLERIAEERENLIREKKIKKPKTTSRIFRRDGHFYESINGGKPTCIDDDIPFEIPDSWEWVRVKELCNPVNGKAFKPHEWKESGLPIVRIQNLNDATGEYNYYQGCVLEQHQLHGGELLFAWSGTPGTSFGAHIWEGGHAVLNQHIFRLDLYFLLNKLYLKFALNCRVGSLIDVAHGGAGLQHVTKGVFESTLIPLPNLKQQIEIVKAIQTRYEYLDSLLVARRCYKRILLETPTSLRQQLIQAAIQGQLVPQNPFDEPASVLLERIAQERTAKQGKKAAKSMSRIERRGSKTYELFPDGSEKDISGEIPFDIPDSWEWSRLSSVLQIARGGSPRPIKDYLTSDENGVNWIKIGDTTKGSKYIFTTREKIKPEGIAKSRLVNPGDFLLSNSMSFGRPYILKTSGCIHDGWLVLSGVELCFNVDFLFYLLSTPLAKSQFAESAAGAVVQNLNIAKVENAIFPIPPMEEQVRIQAAISDLFADMPI